MNREARTRQQFLFGRLSILACWSLLAGCTGAVLTELPGVRAAQQRTNGSPTDQPLAAQVDPGWAIPSGTEQLPSETRSQENARERASDAEVALAKVVTSEEDDRGTVITLPANLLFRSDDALLTSEGHLRLDQIAKSLLMNPDRLLLVEAFTDSEGAADYNIELSQHQANAVRIHLICRGYSGGRVQADGIGEGRPVADNATTEGRAENRRIEIVMEQRTKRR